MFNVLTFNCLCLLIASTGKFELTPNGGKRLLLQPNITLTLMLLKAERSWRFAEFQVHAQYRNVAISTDPLLSYGTTDIGTDTAVLLPFPIMTSAYYPVYLRSKTNQDVNVDVVPVPYKDGGKI